MTEFSKNKKEFNKFVPSKEALESLPKPLRILWNFISIQKGVTYIEGQSGVSKTASMYSLADKLGMNLIDFRLPNVDDVDLGLFPSKVKNEQGVFMDFVPPLWAYQANQHPTIIMFDELDKADEIKYNAALQIFNERCIGHSFCFNDNVYFVACGNPNGRDFGSALKNRIAKIDWNSLFLISKTTIFDYWYDNFAKDNLPEILTLFLKDNLNYFIISQEQIDNLGATQTYASPRSWTYLGEYIKQNHGMNPIITKEFIDELQFAAQAYVGNESIIFINWINDGNFIKASDIIDKFNKLKESKEKNIYEKLKNSSTLVRLINDIEGLIFQQNGNYDMMNLKKEQIENIISFLKMVMEDKRVSFIKNVIDNMVEVYPNKDFLTYVKNNKFYTAIKNVFKDEIIAIKNPQLIISKLAEETKQKVNIK